MKTKNKKRLISLVLVFALVFLTGAAFAFADGILDIVGTVNISAPDELYVIWYEVVEADTLHAEQTADVVNRGGPNYAGGTGSPPSLPITLTRTDQRIVWTIDFDGQAATEDGFNYAFAEISARAENLSDQDAIITRVDYEWLDVEATIPADAPLGLPVTSNILDPAEFGFSVDIDDANFVGTLAGGAITTPANALFVTVEWDGNLPDGFFETEDGQPDIEPGDLVFAGSLVIEFSYAPAG